MKPTEDTAHLREIRKTSTEEQIRLLRTFAQYAVDHFDSHTAGVLFVAAQWMQELEQRLSNSEAWWDWIATDFHCKENVERLCAIGYEP